VKSRKSRPHLCLIAFIVVYTATISAQTWTLHGPPGRYSHSAVWDPNSAQMIIFGGFDTDTNTNLNDVWLGAISTNINGVHSFSALFPTGTAPAGRYGHVAIYDPNSNRMTIFGGALGQPTPCANDVWLLTNANGVGGTANWMQLTPSGTAPPTRMYAGGVYDPKTNSMIVFGGFNCSTGYFNDVWVLSNANGESGTPAWTQLTPSGPLPAARESASVVYDPTDNILMLYSGDAGSSSFGDIWILSSANGSGGTPTWTQLTTTGRAPKVRTGQVGTYDSVNNRMTIFGGISNGKTLTDSWVLTSANGLGGTPSWSQIPTQGTAPSVAYASGVYDSKEDNLYVFAGISTQGKLAANNHAFALSGANGISTKGEKWSTDSPPVRYGQSAFYDSVTNSIFIFAGAHSSSLLFHDYWQGTGVLGSTNLNWVHPVTTGTPPSPRYGHTGLYDSASNRMMVFGGATGTTTCVNDYRVLSYANTQGGSPSWISITPTGSTPPVRSHQSAVFVAQTNQLIIFGGYNCQSTYYNDVWVLNNANDTSTTPSWTLLQPAGTPPTARECASAIYDPTTNEMIVYGGDRGGTPAGDIWILSSANGSGGTPAWSQLTPSNQGPGIRSGHSATYDSTNNIMTIYAGYNGTNVLADAWTLSGANGSGASATWSQLPSNQPRRWPSSMYDQASNQMITFGGNTEAVAELPSAEIYTLTDANGLP
jgi:hypothetical protein